ncbi:3'-5' exonuclease [Pseudomonas sp. GM17]|uniref:3'-5' exonuclease n=1 Tax=Pseudomonas sp. GM17 TaxID=1144323 RepID=UPI0002726D98|nr:3'-5' exonuclease [Pseudomonas sp. GM17]WIE47491.1 3'-5' exonuclease [Pseudomonas sp. GM17]
MQLTHPQEITRFKDRLSRSRFVFCVDLEATCDEIMPGIQSSRQLSIQPKDMEIIEIGLIVLDRLSNLSTTAEFSRLVRPTVHPILTSFCTSLTGIKQIDVERAITFPTVNNELNVFLEPYLIDGAVWCSWGRYDADQLRQDCTRLEVTSLLTELEHLEVDEFYSRAFGISAPCLKEATKSMGIAWHGAYHRAPDDARNLARLLAKLLDRK